MPASAVSSRQRRTPIAVSTATRRGQDVSIHQSGRDGVVGVVVATTGIAIPRRWGGEHGRVGRG
jgi:hypothetical protein